MTQGMHPPPHDIFDTEHLKRDLKSHTLRGGMTTVISQGGEFVLRLVGTAVLARLLTPGDFGIIAMVTALTGLLYLFRDGGLSMVTVNQEKITHDQVSLLFWVNAGLTLLTSGTMAALAPVLVWFYGDPRLHLVTIAIAGSFIFDGLALQHRAILRRQMKYGQLAAIGLLSSFFGMVVGILAAFAGANYWALVLQVAASGLGQLIMCFSLVRWIPGPPRRGIGAGKMLRFGGNLTAGGILYYICRNTDNLLIGATWGPSALGLYNKAYQLLMLPIQQLNAPASATAVSTLSRLQSEPERFVRYFTTGISYLTFLGMPIVFFSFVAADEIVGVILGPGWEEAAKIFRALAPAALMGTFNVATGWVLISTGRADKEFRCALFGTFVTVACFLVGLPYGPIGVALGFSVAHLIYRVPQIVYAYHGGFVRVRDLAGALWRPFLVASAAALLLWGAKQLVGIEMHLALLVIETLLFGIFYFFLYWVIPGGKQFMTEFLDHGRDPFKNLVSQVLCLLSSKNSLRRSAE